jgi:hypothetical protein
MRPDGNAAPRLGQGLSRYGQAWLYCPMLLTAEVNTVVKQGSAEQRPDGGQL